MLTPKEEQYIKWAKTQGVLYLVMVGLLIVSSALLNPFKINVWLHTLRIAHIPHSTPAALIAEVQSFVWFTWWNGWFNGLGFGFCIASYFQDKRWLRIVEKLSPKETIQ